MSELTSVKIISVKPLQEYKLSIIFAPNEHRIFDVAPYIKGDWMGMLRDEQYFNQVSIEPEFQDTVIWPDEQDIAPHELDELSVPA